MIKFPHDVSSIDLDINDTCNFACIYCFHEDMSGHQATHALIDKILDMIPVKRKKPFRINFFGGEPLISFDKIKYMVEGAKKRGLNMQYGVTTNLSLLNEEIAEYFKTHKISVHCSIDGCPEVQDNQRIRKGGRPTSHIIEDKVKYALDITPKDSMRMTIMAKSVQYYFKSVKYAFDLGFQACAPVCVPEDDWTPEALAELDKQLQLTANWAYEQALSKVYRPIKFITDSEPGTKKRGLRMCGAGCGNIAVGLGGDVYPCHRFSRSDSRGMVWMGNIFDENFLNTFSQRRLKINSLHKNDHEMCLHCPAFDFCNGGCPHINVTTSESVDQDSFCPPYAYCEIKRRETHWGLYFWRKTHNVKLKKQREQIMFQSSAIKPSSRASKEVQKSWAERLNEMTPQEYQALQEQQLKNREAMIKLRRGKKALG